MANQGYPNEGADKRLLPGLGFLQKDLIIRKPAPTDVERKKIFGWTVTLEGWPPNLMLEKPTGKERPDGPEYRQIRIGWMWRKNEKYYIPGAAIKKEPGLEPDYIDAKDKK